MKRRSKYETNLNNLEGVHQSVLKWIFNREIRCSKSVANSIGQKVTNGEEDKLARRDRPDKG